MNNKPSERFPLTIGGRDIDISQIGYCLRSELKEACPINKAPEDLVAHINALVERLEQMEYDIQCFISAVRKHADLEDFMSN